MLSGEHYKRLLLANWDYKSGDLMEKKGRADTDYERGGDHLSQCHIRKHFKRKQVLEMPSAVAFSELGMSILVF